MSKKMALHNITPLVLTISILALCSSPHANITIICSLSKTKFISKMTQHHSVMHCQCNIFNWKDFEGHRNGIYSPPDGLHLSVMIEDATSHYMVDGKGDRTVHACCLMRSFIFMSLPEYYQHVCVLTYLLLSTPSHYCLGWRVIHWYDQYCFSTRENMASFKFVQLGIWSLSGLSSHIICTK